MPVGRYQRWINTHIISAVLDRVRNEDDEPLFTLKGGAAMELRLGITARAWRSSSCAASTRGPGVRVYPSWAAGFAAMAVELGFYTDDVEVAADALRAFIDEIDAAR